MLQVFGDDGALDGDIDIGSSNTTKGALPPSSRPSFLRPTVEDLADLGRAGEADKAHARSHKPSPIGRESPVMTLKTPLGTPAFSARAASASAECGVSLVGFSTMVQPAASAGHTLRVIIELRKFHGVMAPQTPIGGLIASSLASGRGEGIVSP